MKFVLKTVAILLAALALLGIGIYLVEFRARGFSLWDSFWYAAVTFLTIGYGDYAPTTAAGRLIGVGLFGLSVVTFSFIMGAINGAVSEIRQRHELGLDGTKFSGHVVVCGWTRVGRVAFRELMAAGRNVAVICEKADQIPLVRGSGDRHRLFVTRGDATLDETLARVNASRAAIVVAALEADSENLILVMQVRRLNPRARVVVSTTRAELRACLLQAGATYVATPYETSGRLIASAAFEPDVTALIDDVSSGVDLPTAEGEGGYDLQQLAVPPTSPLANHPVGDAAAYLRGIGGPLLVALSKLSGSGQYTIVPNPDEHMIVCPSDSLIVLGNDAQNERAARELHVTQGR